MAAHDGAMAQRNRLLAEGRAEPAWLAGLEDAMARHAVAASAARLALVRRLNDCGQLRGHAMPTFPPARIGLVCPIADGWRYRRRWRWRTGCAPPGGEPCAATLRPGTATLGAHRADMTLTDLETRTAAGLASTGQQKALLIGLILSHARLIAAARGFAPLLLLDEPAVHLDAAPAGRLCSGRCGNRRPR